MKKHYSVYSETADDISGCITNTHQCGPCPYNRTCSESTQLSVQEPSPSNWADPDCLPSIERQMRYEH